jgi:hypothetical protein
MTARAMRVLVLVLLAMSLARTAPQDSPSTAFQAQAKLVLVRFSVAQDKSFVAGLKSSDVKLLEDGFSRSFTVFESPASERPLPLEILLLFDTTTPLKSQRWTRWNREAAYKSTARWDEAMSRAILERAGADARISVYHFDQNQMERLCRSSNDPRELTTAFRRLLSPIALSGTAGSSAMPLVLSPNSHLRPDNDITFSPGWLVEATLATMKDSVTPPENARRMLVLFSAGKGGTDTPPESIVYQARALGIPIFNGVIDYDKPPIDPVMDDAESQLESTGGHLFFPSHIDAKVVGGILDAVRDRGLPQYSVGFVPGAAKPRLHNLEIRLKSKSNGRLIGGERKVVY